MGAITMSVTITMREATSPFAVDANLDIKKSGNDIPAGEESSVFTFRLWNKFGGAGSDDAYGVKFSISVSNSQLTAGAANSGNPPPFIVKQTKAGVGAVENAAVDSGEVNIGLDTSDNTWKYFDLADDGYGSSGLADGILEEDGWAEFELYADVPDGLQTDDWSLFIYVSYSEEVV